MLTPPRLLHLATPVSVFLTRALGQGECHFVDPIEATAGGGDVSTCVHSSRYASSFNADYIPSPNDPIQTIQVALHVVQKADGTGNFQENDPAHLAYLQSLFGIPGSLNGPTVNDVFAHIPGQEANGVQSPVSVADSRIRFNLAMLLFHQDNIGWYSNGSSCDCYLYDTFAVDPCKYLNFFLYGRTTDNYTPVAGCGPSEPNYDCTAVNFGNLYYAYTLWPPGSQDAGVLGGHPWADNPLLAHEIGHTLGFNHSWVTCNQFPDLICPHQAGSCAVNTPGQSPPCLNNVMGYSDDKGHWTPLQLGHMQQMMRTTHVAGWLDACELEPSATVVVTTDQVWDRARIVRGNITVEQGAELVITCQVNMPIGGHIDVKPGARLILDGGLITNMCCDEFWDGIRVWGDNA